MMKPLTARLLGCLAGGLAWTVASIASAASETVTLIPQGAVWKYSDAGLNLHASPWKQLTYPDAMWKQGPAQLGYGDGGEATVVGYGNTASNKYPCTYFRRRFTVDTLPTNLVARLLRDDGAVVYLNGQEAFRSNMPTGTLAYTTWASAAADGAAETTWFETVVSTQLLTVGLNECAVEIHQASAASSDMSFDFVLEAAGPAFVRRHDVSITAAALAGPVLPGATVPVEVTLYNAGNVIESGSVALFIAGAPAGSVVYADLGPLSSIVLEVPWNTPSQPAGEGVLTVTAATVPGETNIANNSRTVNATLAPATGRDAVEAVGSVGGMARGVALANGLALLGEGSSLSLLSLADPANPVVLGRMRLSGRIRDVAVQGTLAFAVTGDAGVQIVSLADPTRPRLLSTVYSAGNAYDVALRSNLMFVADGPAGLRVFDIQDPAQPQIVGAVQWAGSAYAVALAGNYACIADPLSGLKTVNIDNPAVPVLAGSCPLVFARALTVSGSYAYVADGAGALHAVNISAPTAPVEAASLSLPAPAEDLAVTGGRLLAAVGAAGLQGVDIRTPGSPVAGTLLALPGEAHALAIEGTRGGVACGVAGLQVLNLTDPAAPGIAGSLAMGARGCDAAMANGYLYVAAGPGGVRTYAITNPAAPALTATLATGGAARDVAAANGYLAIANGLHGLSLASLANPAAPVLAGTCTDGIVFAGAVAFKGSLAAVADGTTVHLVDTSTPAAPRVLSRYTGSGHMFDLAFNGTYLLAAAGGQGLLVLDTSNPGALALVGSVDTPSTAYSVSIPAPNQAMVADGRGGWLLVDLQNPAAPTVIDGAMTLAPSFAVASAAGKTHLTLGSAIVQSFGSTPALAPVPYDHFEPLVGVLRLSAASNLVAAAEDDAGLALLSAVADDRDLDGLSDAWEQTVVEAQPNDTITSVFDVLPGGDPDGDGLNNYAEFLAGTSPTDPASVFLVETVGTGSANAFVVRWNSVANRQYTVYRSTDLGQGFEKVRSGIAATPPLNVFTDSVAGGHAFYMISVEPVP